MNSNVTIWIADSGSTKTAWRAIAPGGQVSQALTAGINPYFQESSDIVKILREELPGQWLSELPDSVFFYGAGCSSEAKKASVEKALRAVLGENCFIEIREDMLAAARAACGKEAGIACILGTGSNSCLYGGGEIISQQPNLGFWLGDEGSGGHLGKLLLTAYLLGELPAALRAKFEKRYPDQDYHGILHKVYKEPMPNRYMASFSKFMFHNLEHPWVADTVLGSFSAFLDKTVCRYEGFEGIPVNFVGSVAFYYNSLLRRAASAKGVYVKNILESPIAGLALYHGE